MEAKIVWLLLGAGAAYGTSMLLANFDKMPNQLSNKNDRSN